VSRAKVSADAGLGTTKVIRGDGVKRPVALLTGLVALPLVAFGPTAGAAGGAVCSIGGTINFFPASAIQGRWTIDPAVINCQGLFRATERIIGPGKFAGAGTYSETPAGSGTCLHHVGTGSVDYMIPTSEADVHIKEPHDFVLAGAGEFATPSLRGSFQITPPYEGDCLSKPVTRATFIAQALLLRNNGLDH
jgi:hypothetical protein